MFNRIKAQSTKKSTVGSAVLLIISVLLGSCNLPTSPAAQVPEETLQVVPTQTALVPTSAPGSSTPEPSPSPVPEFILPPGYQDYSDPSAGITISIPGSWYVTGIQEGQYAILQSYPEDKYIGGEPREEGDTKCDLNLAPDLSGPDDLKVAWENSNITTLLAEGALPLAGGGTAYRYEIDSLGRANLILVDLAG
ncbi:MAG: hypothetical protein P8Y34_03165, partial [Anaerolineales bacterium]